ncbi:MAG: 30S ribosomal protein S7 [Candidatus Aenigmarchaeota archaeon]|nr:30S ribosomal protein S7 [Candidatus Aenigmarchaeota archaeon]
MEAKLLLFNRWDMSEVVIDDPGIRSQINRTQMVIPRSGGKYGKDTLHKSRMNIVERLMNKMMVPGHRGKKHKLNSGKCVGNSITLYNNLKGAFAIIEQKTKKNPIQVLIKALENSSLLEEVASYRMGGTIARKAVIVSPQRRLDLALRHMAQGIYRAKFHNRKPLPEVIADELIAAANNDPKAFPIQERNRIEKEAEGAR